MAKQTKRPLGGPSSGTAAAQALTHPGQAAPTGLVAVMNPPPKGTSAHVSVVGGHEPDLKPEQSDPNTAAPRMPLAVH